jgi:hypothetical protein
MYTYEILIEMAIEFAVLLLLIWAEERFLASRHS